LVTYTIMKQLFNLLIFLAICVVVYIVFRNTNIVEGMETENTKTKNGIAANAADYVSRLTDIVAQRNDILLVNKYRTDYENAILKADDMVDILMLEQVLSINTSKPDHTTFGKIAVLNQAKDGLNKIMKAIDSAKSTDGGIFG
jgi:hypothetical protein